MLYIRADGNTKIGMGHVMRCLSIAEAAVDLGQTGEHRPVFITADEGCRGLIEDRGFDVKVLGTDYKDMLSELPLLEELSDGAQDVFLVDSYQVSAEYFTGLRKFAKAACLEDMGTAYPVDLLVNYNIYAPGLRECYEKADKTTAPEAFLLGTAYMPLRRDFCYGLSYHIRKNVKNVLVTTGGSDPYYAAGAFTKAFLSDGGLRESGITYHVVSGPFNAYDDRLKADFAGNGSVALHKNVKDMKALLKQCDAVLTATGSTIYEISALGVPMVVFYFAQNQRQGAEYLACHTDIVNAGCFATDEEAAVDRAVGALRKCISDMDYRKRLSGQERGLVDGNGAMRIARELLRL